MQNTILQQQTRTMTGQDGVVLPVALFMLLAATILTLALVKANLVSLRVGGASVVAAETQANAELALSNFFSLNGTGTDADPFRKRIGEATDADYNLNAPSHTTITVAARACSPNPPRSSSPTQKAGSGANTKVPLAYNLHQVRSVVDDQAFGSHADVNVGVVTMVFDTTCPKP